MDALIPRIVVLTAVLASLGASYRTPNFIVTANSGSLAREIGDAAETYRAELAQQWLGRKLPRWPQPCPITVNVDPRLGAGGATSFVFNTRPRQFGRVPAGDGLYRAARPGQPSNWEMSLQGSRERVLDSVLPHEVTHTIFATHFGRPLPRWADEGACTTVEHASERAKQERLLYRFLKTGHGIAFNRMFRMTEYPADILPLYSQGYSLTRFLIAQGGRRRFVKYVGDGLDSNNWTGATKRYYGFKNLSELQLTWLDWVRQDSPELLRPRKETSQTLFAREPSSNPQSVAMSGAIDATTTAEPASWYARQSTTAREPANSSPVPPEVHAPADWISNTAASQLVPTNLSSEQLHSRRLAAVPRPARMRLSSRPQPTQGVREVIIEWGSPTPFLAPSLELRRGGSSIGR